MGHRYLAAICCCFLALAACSGPSELVDTAPDDLASGSEESSPEEGGADRGDEDKKKKQKEKGKGGQSEREGSGDDRGGGDQAQSAEDEASEDGSTGSEDPPSETAQKGADFPASGSYVFSQDGYEEFCSGASCDRSDLPPRQKVTSKVTGRSADSTQVLTEIDAEGDRVVRTTTLYSNSRAAVTAVYARFGYSGFVFENNYNPTPAVEILRFPLRTGDVWSGKWKAEVSGSYEARVVGVEKVNVGGRSVEAFKIETSTTFRGEFEGSSDAQIWIDPSTRATVRTSGLLRLRTNFGGYNTAFQTSLISGPGF